MKTIHPSATLFYYDGIQLFEGHDDIGGHYLALLVEQNSSSDQFLVCGISPQQLRLFRIGEKDLRTLIEERPEKEWYLVDIDNFIDPIPLADPSNEDIPSLYLPEPGFLLHSSIEDSFDESLHEARARNNVVIELKLDPPESATGHRIHASTLSGFLSNVQSLIKHAYQRSIKEMSKEAKKGLASFSKTDAHLLDVVVPSAPGSFRIILEASNPPDLFGFNEIIRAIQKIDEVTAVVGDSERSVELLRRYKGHFAGSYLRLLNMIVKTNTGLNYSWAAPDDAHSINRDVCFADVQPLLTELSKIENLTTETVSFIGPLRKVDVDSGTWRINDADAGDVSGKIKEGGPSLSHLETDRTYLFTCEEMIEEIAGTGKEIRTLTLIDYSLSEV